jgi:hypothetical protein
MKKHSSALPALAHAMFSAMMPETDPALRTRFPAAILSSAGMLMADVGMQEARATARIPGLVLIASGIAMIGLLAMHPQGSAKDFAALLHEEAANRGADAVVHGGFIVVLTMQMVCYAIFSRRLAEATNASIAGLVFFCFGAALLSVSALIDGLALPAIAAKYATIPAKLETAQTLHVFGGTMIFFLMPLGIGLQSAGIVAWSIGLLQTTRRAAGVAGLLIGLFALVTTISALSGMNQMALMGGIVALALWAVIAGSTMRARRSSCDIPLR